jgi:hypothetical protein
MLEDKFFIKMVIRNVVTWEGGGVLPHKVWIIGALKGN